MADIAIYNWFSIWLEEHPECFAKTPRLVELIRRTGEVPAIKAWVAARPKSAW